MLRLVFEQTLEASVEIERAKFSAQRTIDVCSVWLEIGDGIGTGEAGETQQNESRSGVIRSESRWTDGHSAIRLRPPSLTRNPSRE